MKLKNVKVGMRVFIKNLPSYQTNADSDYRGKCVTVIFKEPDDYDGDLNIKVETDDNEVDWMSHKDVCKLRDGEV